MSAPPADAVLLTFGPMIDSELSRFLLSRYDVSYREERHLFGWVSILALLRAATPQIPVLFGCGPALVGPRAMLDRFEDSCEPQRKLMPGKEPLRSAVEADWLQFNGDLAAAVARFAYFHLLPHPDVLIEPFSRGVVGMEARLTSSVYPLLRRLFVLGLGLSPAAAADALRRIERIVGDAERRLSDGRSFLHGDRLTLADVALATAIAPLVLPPAYTSPLPALDAMPLLLQDLIRSTRQRPIGTYTARVYAARGEASGQAHPAE